MSIINEDQEKLYDRQIRLWGLQTQERLSNSHILIIGLSIINLEAAKNLLLSGIRLTLCPGSINIPTSLSAIENNLHFSHEVFNFFSSPYKLPDNQYDAVKVLNTFSSIYMALNETVEELKQLNPFVPLDVLSSSELLQSIDNARSDSMNSLHKFTAIIVSADNSSIDRLTLLNTICRKHDKGFFVSRSIGIHGALIQDFGTSHHIDVGKTPNTQSAQCVYFPSFEEILRFPLNSLPSGHRVRKNKSVQPCKQLLGLYALMMYNLTNSTTKDMTFESFALSVMQQGGYSDADISSIHFLQEWKRQDGVAFPTSAAVLGGLLAQEIQRFIGKKNADFKNILIFDGAQSEGLVFNVGIKNQS